MYDFVKDNVYLCSTNVANLHVLCYRITIACALKIAPQMLLNAFRKIERTWGLCIEKHGANVKLM